MSKIPGDTSLNLEARYVGDTGLRYLLVSPGMFEARLRCSHSVVFAVEERFEGWSWGAVAGIWDRVADFGWEEEGAVGSGVWG